MNGIVINIDPVFLHLGGFELRWYGLAIILGVLVAILMSARRAAKKGISPEHIYSLALWAVGGGIIGARLFHVIDRWDYYAANPAQILSLQQGGLAIWGALVVGGLAVLLYARRHHLLLGRLLDVLTPGVLVGQMIGRAGCIINGDAYGSATSLPWGFTYVHPNALIPPEFYGIPTHPYPVYEVIWNLMILAVAWRVERVHKKDGLMFLSYVSLYALGRFVLTFVRQESVWFWGLQEAQVISLLVAAAAAGLMLYLKRRRPAVIETSE